jgi:hypothetical protein
MAVKKYKSGIPLKEGIDVASLTSISKDGFCCNEADMYYNTKHTHIICLQIGNYFHEFDADGKILHSTEKHKTNT